MASNITIASLAEALDYFDETMRAHPERDRMAADQAAIDGVPRPYPVFSMSPQARADDPDKRQYEFELPTVAAPTTTTGDLAREIVGLLAPLRMLNPVRRCLGPGDRGPGTLVASFGIPLRADVGYTPAFTRSLADILDEAPPDPQDSGLLPASRDRIQLIRDHVPSAIKIAMPDVQGPYNLAHAIVGDNALLAPYLEPDGFRRLMERVTTFWIEAVTNIREWIGPDRLGPMHRPVRICECSTNLVSRAMYEEFILPHDLRIAAAFDAIDVHTCSGPHVFHQTLGLLPGVVMTEAGVIANTAAGYTPVDEALATIGDRPIALRIGQELPEGGEFEFIAADLARCRANPRLTFDYTGMHWYNRDCPHIRDLRRRLDDYWQSHCPRFQQDEQGQAEA